MPPEAKDVPGLMLGLINWINQNPQIPCPIVAAIVHYQFATIHPYYEGNGRTARLLTTLILHLGGYDLKGLYSLEEYYARNLGVYYKAISIGPSHNYYLVPNHENLQCFGCVKAPGLVDRKASCIYLILRALRSTNRGSFHVSPNIKDFRGWALGRAEADITKWVEYFIEGLTDSFEKTFKKMGEESHQENFDQSNLIRSLDPKQRKVLELFTEFQTITSSQIGQLFGFKPRYRTYPKNRLKLFIGIGSFSKIIFKHPHSNNF